MNNAYWQVFILPTLTAVAGAMVFGLGAWAVRRVRRKMRMLSADRFWRPLLSRDIDIIKAEYENEPAADASQLNLIRNIGIRHLISKGNSHAETAIVKFLCKEYHFHQCTSYGDKTIPRDLQDNLILLGSPITNNYSASIFNHWLETLDLGFRVESDESTIRIVDLFGKKPLEPKIEGDVGTDYALVIRAKISALPERWCLLLCGASMWGVEGAAKVVTTPRVLKKVSRHASPSNNVAFLVKVEVISNIVHNVEILPLSGRGGRFVRILKHPVGK